MDPDEAFDLDSALDAGLGALDIMIGKNWTGLDWNGLDWNGQPRQTDRQTDSKRPTWNYIHGYSGIAESCVGKANVHLQRGNRAHKEEIFLAIHRLQVSYQGMRARRLASFQKEFITNKSWLCSQNE